MTEAELSELLDRELAAYNLVVQVTQQDTYLLITLNRPADSNLDCTALAEVIKARINTLHLPGIHTLVLCSRVLGEYELDWQTHLELISPPAEPIPQERSSTPITPQLDSEVVATNKSADGTAIPQEFKLSDYCFTRNKSLLTCELLPPPEKIAKLVQVFHGLPDSSKESILPILEPFFRDSNFLRTEQFDSEIQQWFEQFTQLSDAEARKASIWFSRYCFNPEKTMDDVMAVLEPETAVAASDSQEPAMTSPPEQASTTVPKTAIQRTPQAPTRTNISKTKRKTLPVNLQLLALPIAWVIFTVIVITLAVRSVNPSELVATACRNATGKQAYCQLAVQLVGELTFQQVSQTAVPLTPERTDRSLKACEVFGNIRAGKTLREAAKTNIPVLSSFGEEVVPGIFIADVKQTNFKASGSTVRTACVFRNTAARPELIDTEVIPNSWPNEPYKSKPIPQESLKKTLGVYNVFIALGAGTLFTAIGIFIAGVFGLGIRLNSLETLFQAAFFLGSIEAIITLIPAFGWVVAIALESLALGLVSAVVKGFHVEWAGGYRIVAAGAVTIIGLKYLLNLALFGLIASLVH